MALISKHGETLHLSELLTSKIAIMSDGHILQNKGEGWKLYKKLKEGVNPTIYAQKHKDAETTDHQKRPAFHAYKDALHQFVSFQRRHEVHQAILKSENPTNTNLPQQKIDTLKSLYHNARNESKTSSSQKPNLN